MNKAIILKSVSKKFYAGYGHGKNILFRIVGFFGRRRAKKHIFALKNVSFEIVQGEVVGIVGRNGSGKSTLLRLIAGIYGPDSGEVIISGDTMYLNGFNHGIKPRLTMRENIHLVGSILGLRRREVELKFDDIVNFSNLRDFLDVKVYRFSTGMLAKLNFSIFIHFASKKSPDILLLDEVLGSGGDIDFNNKASAKMRDLIEGGTTVLLTSHNMQDVVTYCDKVIWIENGAIKEEGEVGGIIDRYKISAQS